MIVYVFIHMCAPRMYTHLHKHTFVCVLLRDCFLSTCLSFFTIVTCPNHTKSHAHTQNSHTHTHAHTHIRSLTFLLTFFLTYVFLCDVIVINLHLPYTHTHTFTHTQLFTDTPFTSFT